MSQTLTAAGSRSRLEYIPVGLFGSVMGLTGLSIAWRLARERYGLPEWPLDGADRARDGRLRIARRRLSDQKA